MSRYLGINLSHNGSVAVVEDGKIVFYLEEERLTKVKRIHGATSVVSVALEKYPTFDSVYFNGTVSYTEQINEIVTLLSGHPKTKDKPQNFVDHHAAHALSAYYTSPFDGEDALLLVIDGAGENVADGFFETESIFRFTKDRGMEAIYKRYGTNENAPDFFIPRYKAAKQLVGENCDLAVTPFAHITKTYEAICTYLGYPDHEAGKIMGLAPYGKPTTRLLTDRGYGIPEIFACKYPGYARVAFFGLDPEQTHDDRLSDGENQIQPESDQWIFDLAASIQHDTQHAVLRLLQKYINKTGIRNVCTAGGYSLNSICNQFLVDSIPDLKLWSMPVAHDGGIAIGCAYAGHDSNPVHNKKVERLKTLSLGSAYSVEEAMLRDFAQSNFLSLLSVAKMDSARAIALAAKHLSENQSIAWHLGGSEAGPRALVSNKLCLRIF